MEPFATNPLLSGLLPVLLAPFAGSFLGVLIRRLPAGRPIAWSRSACESCDTPLGAADLVPLVSYALSRGRCRHCGAAIAGFHPAIELAATLIAAGAVMTAPDAVATWTACLLGWTLLIAAWIALDHGRLPDRLVLVLLLAGLLVGGWRAQDHAALEHSAWEQAAFAFEAWRLPTQPLIGAVAGFALGALIGKAGRNDILGGEAKLMAAGGAWLGWRPLPAVIAVSVLAGLVLLGACRARGAAPLTRARIPFGPCLALGIWSVFLWRNGSLG